MNLLPNISKIVFVLLLTCLSIPLLAWDGAGTPDDPYQIKTRTDLETLSSNVAAGTTYSGIYFKLMNDIDMTAGLAPNADSNFSPIGNYGKLFSGVFDGGSHIISNLYVYQSGGTAVYIGLFGKTENAVIQNLGLVNVEITGRLYVSALCGWNDSSTITNCYVTGTVTATETRAGGLCGQNNSGTITDCYVTGKITGAGASGIFCGENSNASITNCYATGEAIGQTGVPYFGGFCGWNNGGTITNCYVAGKFVGTGTYIGGFCGVSNNNATITNCYYDKDKSGQSDNDGRGVPLTTASMVETQGFVNSLNGAAGTDSPFKIINILNNDGYPILYWQAPVAEGDGTPESPYQIRSRADLESLSKLVVNGYTFANTHFKLMNDIDMTAGLAPNADSNFSPIGNDTNLFSGVFDGNSYAISNLYVNRPQDDYIGLFRRTEYATIQNLGLVNVDIRGQHYVGGLCGRIDNSITLTNCYVTGKISGVSYVGGFCGHNYSSTITNCYVTGTVTGTSGHIGGFCGYNDNSAVTNCYTTGKVSGTANVGGFCGNNYSSTITNCYVTGTVTGTSGYIGGFCGYNNNSTITNCYTTGKISGSSYIGGFCGKNSNTITNCYTTGKVSGASYVGGFCGENYSKITNCYATGEVLGTGGFVGGFCGYNLNTITNCYFDKDKSGQTDAKATGLTTSAMVSTQVFVNSLNGAQGMTSPFKLTNIFTNDGYPVLSWQVPVVEGDGTSKSPYQIKSRANLETLSEFVANGNTFANTYFKLMNDIDMTAELSPNADSNFSPIGNDTNLFSGVFDGNSHIISNLYVNQPNENYVGLFGRIESATIQNLGLVNMDIAGGKYVGGFCGYNYKGTITNCYAACEVTGTKDYVGGFCGYNDNSTITNCYTTGKVTGIGNVGSFCARADSSTITNCYAVGTVTGTAVVRGFSGQNNYSTITNCYFDKDKSGKMDVFAMGLTTSAMKTWQMVIDLNGAQSPKPWKTSLGRVNDGYPVLAWQTVPPGEDVIVNFPQIAPVNFGFGCVQIPLSASVDTYPDAKIYFTASAGTVNDSILTLTSYVPSVTVTAHVVPDFYIDNGTATQTIVINADKGIGIANAPYQIKTRTDLETLSSNVATDTTYSGIYFKLMNDIDMTAGLAPDADSNFSPIGNDTNPFSGVFDGGSHIISNLYIDQFGETHIGLFGKTEHAVIQNLGLVNVDITGNFYVGSFCGWNNNSTITNCYAMGKVAGTGEYVGGFCGNNINSTIENCCATGEVSGPGKYVGGFCGVSAINSTFTNCYVTGEVSGGSYVGGFCGYDFDSTIKNCYATGKVTGSLDHVGGFCGANGVSSTITNCYAAGKVSGTSWVGGFSGQSSSTITNCYFDKDKSGQTDAFATGLTTSAMVSTRSFVDSLNGGAGMDSPFKITDIRVNNGYPVLYWQSSAAPSPAGPAMHPVAVYLGSKIEISPDSFGGAAFTKKTKFVAEYPNPNGKKAKKVKVQYNSDNGDFLIVKGKVPLYSKQELKTLKNKNTAFTYDILASLAQPPVPLTVYTKESPENTVTMWALPPMIDTVSLTSFEPIFSDGKDSYLILRVLYADPAKTVINGEYMSKGKVKTAKCVILKTKKLDQFLTSNPDAEAWYEFLGSTAIEHEFVMVIKLNKQFIKQPADTRFDIVIDNKNGFDAVPLR